MVINGMASRSAGSAIPPILGEGYPVRDAFLPRVQLPNPHKSLSAFIFLRLQTHRFGREFLLHGLLSRIERNGEADCQYCCDHNGDNEAAHAVCTTLNCKYVPLLFTDTW